ncbi:MAG: cytochrome P450 [Chloroflexia bacterium]|nr:cytochrome P450 [Chloroflexia bacterium]
MVSGSVAKEYTPVTSQTLPPFDFASTYRDGNPYPSYARYRTQDPVHVLPDDIANGTGAGVRALLFGHTDCMRWLRDQRLGREWHQPDDGQLLPRQRPNPEPDSFGAVANLFMLFRDPPVHTRLRGVANMAFTPRQVEKLRPQIEAMAIELANELRDANGDDVDLIGQFAFPLPMLVIAEMLGIPREDFRKFRSLAGDIAAAIDFPVDGLGEFLARVDQSTKELAGYLRWLIATRRTEPRDDLLSLLIHAEADEGRLSEEELVATCILLLVAGHETTVNLIGNGTLALMRHPDQWRALVAEPGLARNAAEELLRYDAPVQLTARHALEPVEIGGVEIDKGTHVSFVLGSANRDESVFEQADRLDIRRDVGRIMSFGMGIHFCLGAPLARMEGEIAFATLARQFPKLSLVSDKVHWRPGAVFHGLSELPLSLGSPP